MRILKIRDNNSSLFIGRHTFYLLKELSSNSVNSSSITTIKRVNVAPFIIYLKIRDKKVTSFRFFQSIILTVFSKKKTHFFGAVPETNAPQANSYAMSHASAV